MKVNFGALAPTLREQISNISDKDAETFDAHNRAINLLKIHGLMTEAEAHKIRLRLIKKISVASRKFDKEITGKNVE
jgi:hypothetical protein